MQIINRTRIDNAIVTEVAQHSLVAGENFVLFLDDKVNAVRADAARAKLEEHPNWPHVRAAWETDGTGENDLHACIVCRRTIASQKLPKYVIDAINDYGLLVYVDATWTAGPQMGFAMTLAHELRHVWQYFNAPVVFHSHKALSGVMPSQETPCERDTEKASKRVPGQIYGDATVRDFLQEDLARCKPEHREGLERLAALDPAADPDMEANTIALLEQHAAEIREAQAEYKSVVPGYVMPGIQELVEALRGRSAVRLLP